MKSTKGTTKEQKLISLIEDKYTLKETIGKGTFGKVKLGIARGSNKKVAIKILEKAKIVSKDDSERVKRELDIISRCSHPNVIQTYEIINSKEHFFIIMEYCEGGELFNHIVRKQRLSEDEAAYFYYQLINGLEYIHSINVVHRDLKPENLLLAKGNILKIIDFGLSNYYNGNMLRTPCGSPCYASPEMVSGNKYNGYYIDVWSTGIILFAMLCGYLPFEDEDNEVLFKKILRCQLNYPSHVSPKAKGLLQKILETDPEKRIKVNEIKQHQYYLRGKYLFELNYPPAVQLNNNTQQDKLEETDKENRRVNVIEEKEIKYIPFNTEYNDYNHKQIKIDTNSKKSNEVVIETEGNIRDNNSNNNSNAIRASIKDKMNNLQSFLYSKTKMPSYAQKTVSTNETGNGRSRSNTLSNELRNTILKEQEIKRKTISLISPKGNTHVKTTIDSYSTKHKDIMASPISPLSSFVSVNKKTPNTNYSRANTEQNSSSIYHPAKPELHQKTSMSMTKNDPLSFRKTMNYSNRKEITINLNQANTNTHTNNTSSSVNKKIQLLTSPKHPYAKPIITQPNFPLSHLSDRTNCNLKQSIISNSTNTSYSLSFLQNAPNPNPNKMEIKVSSIMSNPKPSNQITSSPIYIDYLSNKKQTSNNNTTKYITVDKGSKYSSCNNTSHNNKGYNGITYSNLNFERIQQRLSMNYAPKETPLYINTETQYKYNNNNKQLNDLCFSRNTPSNNPTISSTPNKKQYYCYSSNGVKPSANKYSLNNTLQSFQSRIKGIY